MPVITDLVTAVLARLAEVGALPYCKAFEPIPARLTARKDDEIWNATLRALQNRCPFILVATDDIRSVTGKVGGVAQDWRCDLDVFVYCGSDHHANMVAGRLDPDEAALADPSADPGVRQMLEDVFFRLAGWAPVTATARMNPVRGSWVLVSGALSIWEWTFSTEVVLASQPLPPRPRFTSALVDNQTHHTPPAIIVSEELP